MSAVEVITAALAAGAGVGMKDTASAVVRDSYAGLKDLLRRRFGDEGDRAAARELEANETEPGVWQARIGEALAASGAVDDKQVLDAARRLLAVVNHEKTTTFDIDVQTNHGAIGQFQAPMTFNQAPSVPPAPPAAG